jgi:hypothetical protein
MEALLVAQTVVWAVGMEALLVAHTQVRAVGMEALLVAQTVVWAVDMSALLVGMLQLQGMHMPQGTVRVWQGRVTVAGSMAVMVVC